MDLARTVHPRGEELRRAELALEYSDPHADGVLRAGGRFRAALPRLWVQSLAVDRPRRAPSHRRHPGCPMIGAGGGDPIKVFGPAARTRRRAATDPSDPAGWPPHTLVSRHSPGVAGEPSA